MAWGQAMARASAPSRCRWRRRSPRSARAARRSPRRTRHPARRRSGGRAPRWRRRPRRGSGSSSRWRRGRPRAGLAGCDGIDDGKDGCLAGAAVRPGWTPRGSRDARPAGPPSAAHRRPARRTRNPAAERDASLPPGRPGPARPGPRWRRRTSRGGCGPQDLGAAVGRVQTLRVSPGSRTASSQVMPSNHAHVSAERWPLHTSRNRRTVMLRAPAARQVDRGDSRLAAWSVRRSRRPA